MKCIQYPSGIKAVFFDFMGTCLDWYSGITAAFPERLDENTKRSLSISWRESFFADIHERFKQGLPMESFDTTNARQLELALKQHNVALCETEKIKLVQAWHSMPAWKDVAEGLMDLKGRGLELFVLANGTTRLQLDLVLSSKLCEFDMLFSSELLNLAKPDPEFYALALKLTGYRPEETAMVAAHAYDLRAAQRLGMKTVYISRWTEDTQLDLRQVYEDVDGYIGSLRGHEEEENSRDPAMMRDLSVALGLEISMDI
ncbi:haloacid dehalogenase [Talaromyces proteolyticus]|uniref:Haloacid dehalogenase n=1 Tax=Talaromyces proteolyticus TaxID=1131652 RepID=A0AAD4Q0N8_9EURO|nr:haloacid dehalogenase [Talaromyces proteolyticus]KAH8697456.1 haloacid dehalogenase [Talaromyces proteolyticus]